MRSALPILGLYYTASVMIGLYVFSEVVSLAFARQDWKGYVQQSGHNPFMDLSIASFTAGFYLDKKYFGGAVLRDYLRRLGVTY